MKTNKKTTKARSLDESSFKALKRTVCTELKRLKAKPFSILIEADSIHYEEGVLTPTQAKYLDSEDFTSLVSRIRSLIRYRHFTVEFMDFDDAVLNVSRIVM